MLKPSISPLVPRCFGINRSCLQLYCIQTYCTQPYCLQSYCLQPYTYCLQPNSYCLQPYCLQFYSLQPYCLQTLLSTSLLSTTLLSTKLKSHHQEDLLKPSISPLVPRCFEINPISVTPYQMFGQDHDEPLQLKKCKGH